MKYIGVYWTLFASMIKKSIRARFGSSLAERTIREGKRECAIDHAMAAAV